MDQLTRKTFPTSRGFTYTYYVRGSSTPGKPALLLQHGFPDDAELWAKIIPYLLDLDFPIVVPDLLGYNGTSKPVDVEAYNSKGMANDLAELLDNENIKHCISIGHDWGSFMAQRVALWHPDRVVGMILLNVTYRPPTEFDAIATNALLVKTTGLPRIAYQQYFVSPPAQQTMEDNLESCYAAMHGSDEGTTNFMEDMLCHHGALDDFIKNNKRQPLKDYANDPAFKEKFITRFKRDGLTGPLNWYKATHSNIHWEVEKNIPKEQHKFNIPVLFIGATKDPVCLTQYIHVPQQAGLLPDLTIKEVESGHWQPYEVPEKTGPVLAEWLKEREADLKPKL